VGIRGFKKLSKRPEIWNLSFPAVVDELREYAKKKRK
jgi:hypothetical protein